MMRYFCVVCLFDVDYCGEEEEQNESQQIDNWELGIGNLRFRIRPISIVNYYLLSILLQTLRFFCFCLKKFFFRSSLSVLLFVRYLYLGWFFCSNEILNNVFEQ